jgi:2-polyprenyl-3-methyl-5-hydroxy-6-metoxy-1,4-benzoquinol methylase
MKTSVLKQENIRFWEFCFSGSNYDYKSLTHRNWATILKSLKHHKVRKVLDVGCGFGHWSIVLARAGFKVTAIDIAKAAIKILKGWAKQENLDIDLEVCPIQQFRNKARTYDAVICNSVLDHMMVKDAKKAISNIRHVLKPKGIAHLSFDGPEKDTKDFQVCNDGTRHYVKGKFKGMLWHYYSDVEIKDLCKNFKIITHATSKNGRRTIWMSKLS